MTAYGAVMRRLAWKAPTETREEQLSLVIVHTEDMFRRGGTCRGDSHRRESGASPSVELQLAGQCPTLARHEIALQVRRTSG